MRLMNCLATTSPEALEATAVLWLHRSNGNVCDVLDTMASWVALTTCWCQIDLTPLSRLSLLKLSGGQRERFDTYKSSNTYVAAATTMQFLSPS